MTDRGTGYMINVGDKIIFKNGEEMNEGTLFKIDMEGVMDTIELASGELVEVERTTIYPENIKTIYSFKKMKSELNEGICEVTFTKKNGEERVMPCTLVFDHIPEDLRPKGNVTQHRTQDTIAVWCMDKEAWRSFRVDSVTKFERLTGHGRGEKKTIKLDGMFK